MSGVELGLLISVTVLFVLILVCSVDGDNTRREVNKQRGELDDTRRTLRELERRVRSER